MNVAFVVTAHIIEFVNKQLDQYQMASRDDSINEIPPHLMDDVISSSDTKLRDQDSKWSK